MSCRIGITTKPSKSRRYWEKQYSTMFNWLILERYDNKTDAEEAGDRLRVLFKGKNAPNGEAETESEKGKWVVYKFDYYVNGKSAYEDLMRDEAVI